MTAPVERQHHGVTLAVLAVAALAYLLTASVATPILGRLGDMFGKERMMVAVLVLFALGSLIAALSHSIGLLVAGRAVQGAGGAVFPLAFGIIRDEFPRERVATGIGLISATFGIGGAGGLVLSAWLRLRRRRDGGRAVHASLRGDDPDRRPAGRRNGWPCRLEAAGEATGMNTIMRTVGGAFGGQIAAAIVAGHVIAGTGWAAESGFTAAFVMGGVAAALAVLAAMLIPGRGAPSVLAPSASEAPARG